MTDRRLRDVFKFLMVRPALSIGREDDSHAIIRIPDEFLNAHNFVSVARDWVLSGKELTELRSTAIAFLESSDAIRGFRSRDKTVAKLHDLLVASRRIGGLTVKTFAELVSSSLGLSPDKLVADQTFLSVHARLWNTFYARFVTGDDVHEDLTELCDLLRITFAVVGTPNPTFSDRQLSLRLSATPVVDDVFARAPGKAASVSETTAVSSKAKAEYALNSLRSIDSYETAIVEVTKASRDTMAIRITQELADQGDSGKKGNEPSRSRTGGGVLHGDSTKALSPTTRSLISAAGRDLAVASADDIVRDMKSGARRAYQDLHAVGGLALVEAARREISNGTSAGFTTAPTWLEDFFPGIPFDTDPYDNSIFTSLGSVKPIGIGDLQVLKETLKKYEMGEVAYIENVMRSERRQRVHRKLDRIEETTTIETMTETETERDLQTTERYELQTETSETIETNQSLDAGVSVSGSYGPVKVSASADYSTSSAKSEAATSSTAYAQEVVDQSIARILESVREEQTVTTIAETEETNTHTFDNTAGASHVVGIYRWVDKLYEGQIYTYGRRLMFEFCIPDPAAFYRFAADGGKSDEDSLPTAPEPLPDGFSPGSITETTYMAYVATYGVQDVDPPPAESTVVNRVYSSEPMIPDGKKGMTVSVKEDNTLSIPTGYEASEVWIRKTSQSLDYFEDYEPQEDAVFRALVGNRYFDLIEDASQGDTMEGETGTVGIALRTVNLSTYIASVEIVCTRLEETLDSWRLDVYEKIVAAYNAALDIYETAVATAENVATASQQSYQETVLREIEQTELKKHCLTMLTDQHYAEFDAMVEEAGDLGYPEINIEEAAKEGKYVQFFEQAFEWENMTYLFYSYFWGRKSLWPERIDPGVSSDSTFSQFLRAGSARVLVPVRGQLAYVRAVLHYLETGEIWLGGDVPLIDDPLYVSIVQELKEATQELPENAEPIGEPWTYTLPTDLVILQDDGVLPDWTGGT